MQPSGILTLLTDFGTVDHYVSVMKGVILSRAPKLTLIDVTHAVPPQNIERAGWVLSQTAPWFPPGTVHVVVVDPGVGSERKGLLAQCDEQWVVAPDNGVISWLAGRSRTVRAWELAAPGLGLAERSDTFHGRDLFAPAGALLAGGRIHPQECGPALEPILLHVPPPQRQGLRARGRVTAIDHFGNLVTDLSRDLLDGAVTTVQLGEHRIEGLARTYSDGESGQLVALYGSGGLLEVSVVDGNAAERLGVQVGLPVVAELA